MNFNDHWQLEGKHAFLGASKFHWIRYSDEKLIEKYRSWKAAEDGIRKHDLAKECILLGVKLQASKKTLNMFVNDAIGFRMAPEQILYYSSNAFGTTDAISFRKNLLRIHDLKNGVTAGNMDQLLIYAAYFCLEYSIRPEDIDIELRIYQFNEIEIYIPEPEEIRAIMDKTILFDRIIMDLDEE